jgi:hypothetical protein
VISDKAIETICGSVAGVLLAAMFIGFMIWALKNFPTEPKD